MQICMTKFSNLCLSSAADIVRVSRTGDVFATLDETRFHLKMVKTLAANGLLHYHRARWNPVLAILLVHHLVEPSIELAKQGQEGQNGGINHLHVDY